MGGGAITSAEGAAARVSEIAFLAFREHCLIPAQFFFVEAINK